MRKTVIDISRKASLVNVRELRKLLDIGLSACNIDSEQRSNIILCFSEAATNCIEHAQSVKHIGLSLYSDAFGWWVEVKDDGAYNNLDITAQFKPITDFDINTENGRGWALITTLAERVEKLNTCTELSDKALPENDTASSDWTNRLRMGWQHSTNDIRATLIVVDDDLALTTLYQAYLEQDFNVLVANDGKAALEIIAKQHIDLVISDINMPNMDGIALRDALNADQKTEITPFIFLTVTEDHKMRARTSQMGIDDYLHKPIDKASLLHTIQRVLARSERLKQRLTERIDRHITAALAPELPQQLGNWRIALGSRNTGHGGGDLVLHQMGETSQLIVVVDVMGHNDAAKFFSHAYAGYLRGLMAALGNSLGPSRLLERLSQGIYDDKLLSQLTLTCCVVELKGEGLLEVATAGHPAPIHLSKAGTEVLPVEGMLPGLLPGCAYPSYTLQLNIDERLAVYTDGLIESAEDNVARHKLEATVLTSLVDGLDFSPEQAVDKTIQIFDHATAHQPSDDALLLLIERLTE